jgi:hypothetical protein
MADIQSVADLVTQRDNMQTALDELMLTGITNYTIGGRTVTYELRQDLQSLVNQLNRRIAARTTSTTRALGYNLVDFSQKTKVIGAPVDES